MDLENRRAPAHLQIDDARENIYRRDKIQNGVHYYRCTMRGCSARAVLNDSGFTVSDKTRHNHGPRNDDIALILDKWLRRNKELAASDGDSSFQGLLVEHESCDDNLYVIPSSQDVTQASASLNQKSELVMIDVRSLASEGQTTVKCEVPDECSTEEPHPVVVETTPVLPTSTSDAGNPVTSSGARKRRHSPQRVANKKEELETEVLAATIRKLEADRKRSEAEAAFWREEAKKSAIMAKLLSEQHSTEIVRRRSLLMELRRRRRIEQEERNTSAS